ncbi:DeoR faimly transcriptional regulator [Pseudomonas putida]|nr:DeoR faimly transcriptional regulator [Pseudomonas putida]
MTDEAQRWKEKYLKSIEQQEKLERRWDARLDLLRRGLVRSTLAAEGSDRAVDQCMKEMREVIRTDNMDAALAGLIPRLEKAVLDSEQRRETRIAQVGTALNALVAQLQKLPLPSEVSRPLKKFAKQLDARASQSREMPLLLSELSGLQGKALAVLEHPEEASKPGFLQRLFGGREEETQVAQPEAQALEPVAQAAVEPVHEQPAPAAADVDELQPLPEPQALVDTEDAEAAAQPIAGNAGSYTVGASLAGEEAPALTPPPTPAPVLTEHADTVEVDGAPEPTPEELLYALPDGTEPSYSSVATHIEQTLLGLLDDLTLPERHKPQALAVRQRLEHGLNWYELLPVLDDLAVLMLAITDSGQHEFEAYLQQLNERLEGLLGTMDEHQHQRDLREQELASRLQGLAERVASMEQEALGYREHLEEQRQKALIDPLTGLPNRAAWAERLEQEMLAWQENGGHLLMAMLDLDHFKRINDSYGHQAGDKVLKIVANELRKRLRSRDFIARFGGEEFVLLVPQTALGSGIELAETLRGAIEACPFHFKGERVTITLSIGITAFRSGERSDAVLKRADEALYRAKHLGRNRVEQG